MKTISKQYLYALGAFMAAWQATNFSLDYRAILGAITCAFIGGASPKK
jgi:hypothetical protein